MSLAVSGVSTSHSESPVGAHLLVLLGEDHGLDGERGLLGEGHDLTLVLDSLGELLLRGLTGVDLLGVDGEDHEVLNVLLETSNVGAEGLHAFVATTLVNGDADGAGVEGADPRSLELSIAEPATLTELHAVATRGAANDGAESLNRAREAAGGLDHSVLVSPLLAGGLVEPGLHAELPLLVEVLVRNLVVMTDHL